MIRKLLNQRGMTLMEMLATMTLLTLLLSVAYPVFLIGVKTFDRGQTRSNLQDQVRLASLTVTKALRYASEVSIVSGTACPTPPLSSDPSYGYNFICVDSSGHAIKNLNLNLISSSYQATSLIEDPIGKQSFDLTFTMNAANAKILGFVIAGSSANESYQIQSEVSILNAAGNIQGTSGYKVIRYK
jgi:prepilin-type N-terminal cleavage/methylation domain-containing protein